MYKPKFKAGCKILNTEHGYVDVIKNIYERGGKNNLIYVYKGNGWDYCETIDHKLIKLSILFQVINYV